MGKLFGGKYNVAGFLGEGAMGVVFGAVHTELRERVAIKVLAASGAGCPEARARFLREARAAARIRSENVARVIDVGELDGGRPYLVMEYLEGEDLATRLQRTGPLPVSEALDYALQACKGVAAAHALGIVHRDLKPANLFSSRRPDGSALVKVLDFGVSKVCEDDKFDGWVTGARATLGSPAYMSPEQMRSARDVDGRTDVWALGVVLYELLTNAVPFDARTLGKLVLAVHRGEPTPLAAHRRGLPEGLQRIVSRCLNKDPGERYATVRDLADALEEIAGQQPGVAESVACARARSSSAHPTVRPGLTARRGQSQGRAAGAASERSRRGAPTLPLCSDATTFLASALAVTIAA